MKKIHEHQKEDLMLLSKEDLAGYYIDLQKLFNDAVAVINNCNIIINGLTGRDVDRETN